MVKRYNVQSVDLPLDIELTSKKVFITKNLHTVTQKNDAEEYTLYEFDLEEYDKDEYLLKLNADLAYLAMCVDIELEE